MVLVAGEATHPVPRCPEHCQEPAKAVLIPRLSEYLEASSVSFLFFKSKLVVHVRTLFNRPFQFGIVSLRPAFQVKARTE